MYILSKAEKIKLYLQQKKIFFVPVIVGVDIYLDSNFSSIIGYALAAYVFHSVYKAVNALKLNGKELISNFVGKIESFSPLITSLVYGVDGIMTIIAVGTGGITLAFTPILKIAIKLVINYLATKYAVSYITGGKRILAGNERGTITSIGFSANVSGVSYQ